MTEAANDKPQFGIEQEYAIYVTKGSTSKVPLGWPEGGFPARQGQYYSSIGAGSAFGRELVEAHQRACSYAGLNYAGLNAETLPAQWEFQIGICDGLDIGDELLMGRYLLHRCGEFFGFEVSFDPKPIDGDWSGSGGHINFSTERMRTPTIGVKEIEDAIKLLAPRHKEHIELYGEGNERRLVGAFETPDMDVFSWGLGSRTTSVRVPNHVVRASAGYFEDRRPAANIDPYLATSILVDTICLNSKYGAELKKLHEDFLKKLKKFTSHH